MRAGLATRQRLARAVQREIYRAGPHVPHRSEDQSYEFLHGRASNKLTVDDFALPARPFMPNQDSLGTPAEAARLARDRIERKYDNVACVAGAIVVALLFASLAIRNAPQPKVWPIQHDPVDSHSRPFEKARMLAVGENRYQLDPRENCLISMHKDALGQPVVSDHC